MTFSLRIYLFFVLRNILSANKIQLFFQWEQKFSRNSKPTNCCLPWWESHPPPHSYSYSAAGVDEVSLIIYYEWWGCSKWLKGTLIFWLYDFVFFCFFFFFAMPSSRSSSSSGHWSGPAVAKLFDCSAADLKMMILLKTYSTGPNNNKVPTAAADDDDRRRVVPRALF
jgi:hypothetical protein